MAAEKSGCATALAILGGLFLLWPGACFLSVGWNTDLAASLIGLVILAFAGWLLWIGLRRKSPTQDDPSGGKEPESER